VARCRDAFSGARTIKVAIGSETVVVIMVLVGKDGVIVGLARVRAPLDPLVVIVAREHNDVVVA
jgi:hypothetical protein